MKKYLIFLLTSFVLMAYVTPVQAQSKDDRWHIRKGNKFFRQGRVDEAATEYKKAIEYDSLNSQAIYNRGRAVLEKAIQLIGNDHAEYNSLQSDIKNKVDTLFHQADSLFMIAIQLENNPIRKAMSWHNIGWTYQKQELFRDAIEAYKEALRNNPRDEETRYNLALCQYRLKNDKNEGENNQQDQNKQGNVSVYVKDAITHEPIVQADIVVMLTDQNGKQTRSQAMTDSKGLASFPADSTVKYKQISLKASKANFMDSTLVSDLSIEDFKILPENKRTIWLKPEPDVVYFTIVDSKSGKPLPNVDNAITITSSDGTAQTYQEMSNDNGKIPIKVVKGDKVSIVSKLKNYKDKNTVIPSYEKPEIIKMDPKDQNDNQNQDKKDQNKQKDQDQEQQQQQQQQQEPRISEQNMQRMLDAVNRKEQETQGKLEKAKSTRQSRSLDKNW